jgi:hypothetical protein
LALNTFHQPSDFSSELMVVAVKSKAVDQTYRLVAIVAGVWRHNQCAANEVNDEYPRRYPNS